MARLLALAVLLGRLESLRPLVAGPVRRTVHALVSSFVHHDDVATNGGGYVGHAAAPGGVGCPCGTCAFKAALVANGGPLKLPSCELQRATQTTQKKVCDDGLRHQATTTMPMPMRRRHGAPVGGIA
jgi:hypothetical protein